MSDPEEQAALEHDDLFHTQLSLRLGGALLDTGRWVLKNADKLAVPTLLSHGTQDCLTCPWASKEFSEKAGEICRLLLLPDQLHDPFRDLERKAVIEQFHAFLQPWVEKEAV